MGGGGWLREDKRRVFLEFLWVPHFFLISFYKF
jgi:hypothetical protein